MLAVYHVVGYAPTTLPCNQCYGPTILPQTSKKTYNNTVSSTTVVVYTGKYNYDALAAVSSSSYMYVRPSLQTDGMDRNTSVTDVID